MNRLETGPSKEGRKKERLSSSNKPTKSTGQIEIGSGKKANEEKRKSSILDIDGQGIKGGIEARLFMLQYNTLQALHDTPIGKWISPETKEKIEARKIIRTFIKQVYTFLSEALPDPKVQERFFRAVQSSIDRPKGTPTYDPMFGINTGPLSEKARPEDVILTLLSDPSQTHDTDQKYKGFDLYPKDKNTRAKEYIRLTDFAEGVHERLNTYDKNSSDIKMIDDIRLVNMIKRQLHGLDEFGRPKIDYIGNLQSNLRDLRIDAKTFHEILNDEVQWVESARRIKRDFGKNIPDDL